MLTVPWEEIDEILDLSPPYLRRDGDGTLYLDPETGQEIILVPMDEFERVMNEAYSSTEALNPEPQTALPFSPDGATWSLQPTTAAFGEAGWIEAMAVGDDVIVAVFRPHGDGYPQTEAEAELYRPHPPNGGSENSRVEKESLRGSPPTSAGSLLLGSERTARSSQ